MMIWGGRTYPYPAEIRQGWHRASHDSILGRFCMEGGSIGISATSMQFAKIVCGEKDEMLGPFWYMTCCERYRTEVSKIRCRIYVYKAKDGYISLSQIDYLICRFYQ